MSAEILAGISVGMLGLGSLAILAIMVGLTWNVMSEGWLRRPVRIPARRAVSSDQATQPIRTAA